jgi:hypothetical protein
MAEGRMGEGRTTALHRRRLAGPDEEPLSAIAQSGRSMMQEVVTSVRFRREIVPSVRWITFGPEEMVNLQQGGAVMRA